MSVSPPPERMGAAGPLKDMAHLRARRRQARRRRHLLRMDIALGLLIALLAVLLAPGMASAAIAALTVFAICVVSILLDRWRAPRDPRKPGSV